MGNDLAMDIRQSHAVAIGLDQVERMAKWWVDSGLGVKSLPQAVTLMLYCQAKGMHPMEAMDEFHIVQGRMAMKSERMLAKFQSAGGKTAWDNPNDSRAALTLSHPLGGTYTAVWDIERAKRAGLTGKDNWKFFPGAMLRARCISEGVRAVLPGALSGAYTPEELVDLPSDPAAAAPAEKDVTPRPASGVDAVAVRMDEIAAQGPGKIERIETERPELVSAGTDDFALTMPTKEEQVLAGLRDESLKGEKDLRAAWEGLTPDMRKGLSSHLPSLKEAAAKADAAAAALRG